LPSPRTAAILRAVKVKTLGLPRRKGLTYAVSKTGVIATEHEESTVVRRLTIKQDPRFLYYIDDDGDLAREFNGETPEQVRDKRAWRQVSATTPASASLDTAKLYKVVLDLVAPATRLQLGHAGLHSDEHAAARAAAVYHREAKRLVREITLMFGPPFEHHDEGTTDAFWTWRIRGQTLALVLGAEDDDLPAAIFLGLATDVTLAQIIGHLRG